MNINIKLYLKISLKTLTVLYIKYLKHKTSFHEIKVQKPGGLNMHQILYTEFITLFFHPKI